MTNGMLDKWPSDVGIRVKDLQESLRFYTEVLGLVEIYREL